MLNGPTRLQIGLYVTAVVAMLALALRDWNNYTVGIFVDDALYVVLAQSFSRGVAYGLYFMPELLRGTPLPFGMPLLLAPLAAWFPDNYDVLRLVPLGASVLSVSLIFWGWNRLARGFSYWWGVALVTVLALSPLTVLYARVILSEAPFLAWSLIAVLVAERLTSKPSFRDGVAFGFAALGLVFTRSIGWFMLAALVVYIVMRLRRRAWRPLTLAGVSFAALTGLLVAVTPIGPGDLVPSDYVDIIIRQQTRGTGTQAAATNPIGRTEQVGSQALTQLGRNVATHLDFTDWLPNRAELEAKRALASAGLDFLLPVPAILLLALGLVGVRQWYRTSGLTAFGLAALPYLAVILIWVWDGARLFYPIQPQIVFALMLGVYGVGSAAMRRMTKRALSPVLIGVLLGALVCAELLLDLRTGGWFLPREVRGTAAEWIVKETPPDAVVLTLEPATYYLYAPRPYVPVPKTLQGDQELAQLLRDLHVNFVIAPIAPDTQEKIGRSSPPGEQAFIASAKEFGARGLLVERFVNKERNVKIFQVDEGKLARETE